MIPLRLLKKAVFDKFDKDNDFDPSLKYFRHTQSSIDGTVNDNYPYAFYVFNTANDQLEMGDYMPVSENNVLTFHLFSLGDQTSTEIEKKKIIFDINYPLSIKKQNKTYKISEFSETVPVRMGVIYDSVKEFERDNAQKISLVDISEIASEKELEIDFIDYNNQTVIFNVTDTKSQLNGKSLSWIFANEY